MRGMLSASHAAARAANSATVSVVVGADVVSVISSLPVPCGRVVPPPVSARRPSGGLPSPACAWIQFGERVDAQIVVLGCTEQGTVEHHPAQIEVQVVLPRHTDAT